MGELSLRKQELRSALVFAEREVTRADALVASGDMTFRMYLEFKDRVADINDEIDAIDNLILAGEE